MIRYIIKRLVYAVLTLFVLISLTFFMMRMLPGDPFIGDKTVSATAMANMNAKYGLDKPVFVQYLMYMGNCLRGDLGISITYNRDVMTSSPNRSSFRRIWASARSSSPSSSVFCSALWPPSSAAARGTPYPCSSP